MTRRSTRTYRGVNALALAMSPRAFGGDPRWMSYRQAAARGWQVRKGGKSVFCFPHGKQARHRRLVLAEAPPVKEPL
jgi:antirestriction protein ArdC